MIPHTFPHDGHAFLYSKCACMQLLQNTCPQDNLSGSVIESIHMTHSSPFPDPSAPPLLWAWSHNQVQQIYTRDLLEAIRNAPQTQLSVKGKTCNPTPQRKPHFIKELSRDN